MVSLCAGCNLYEPWAAIIVGCLGGVGCIIVHHIMLRLRLDDPLDAVAVHGAGGVVGILSVPWFMYVGLDSGQRGILWDWDTWAPWLVLAYNIAGSCSIILWSTAWSVLIFGSLYLGRMLRVTTDQEYAGMDLVKHGEAAYPPVVSSALIYIQPIFFSSDLDGLKTFGLHLLYFMSSYHALR